jgi:hypothetical protein
VRQNKGKNRERRSDTIRALRPIFFTTCVYSVRAKISSARASRCGVAASRNRQATVMDASSQSENF